MCPLQASALAFTGVRPVLIWDADDTLWFVEQLYDDARAACASIVGSVGLDPAEWDRLERQIDVENVARLGLDRSRFPTSCAEAYEVLSERSGSTPDLGIRDQVFRRAMEVFARKAPLAVGARAALITANEFSRQVLLTKGDREVQEERIAQSGLRDLFERILIVSEKTSDTFRSAIRDLDDASSQCAWSIGNSLPSDINPALAAGLSAIWIDAHVWEHERRETSPTRGRLHVAATLAEAVEIVKANAEVPHVA